MARDAKDFVNSSDITKIDVNEFACIIKQYINKMSNDITEIDNTIGVKNQPTTFTPLNEDLEVID